MANKKEIKIEFLRSVSINQSKINEPMKNAPNVPNSGFFGNANQNTGRRSWESPEIPLTLFIHDIFLYGSVKIIRRIPQNIQSSKKKVFGTRVTPLTLQKLFILTGNSALVKFLLKAKA